MKRSMAFVLIIITQLLVTLSVKAKVQSPEKVWDSARRLLVNGKAQVALNLLKQLVKNENRSAKLDINQIYLTLGRAYYQRAEMEEAIKAYERVDKSSDFWPESIEEKAWAYVSLHQEEKALAQLETLMTPLFDQVIGPEPYFLKSLTHLRLCDYNGVFKTTQLFKNRYRTRIEKLQNLVAKKGMTPEVVELIKMASVGSVSPEQLTKKIVAFPIMFQRDRELQILFLELQVAKNKQQKGEQIAQRIFNLTKSNLQEVEKNLNLLHVVEAEAIQRVHIANRPNKEYRNRFNFKGSDWMSFPVSDEEIWVDEIDNFKVQVKDCPGLKERKTWAKK